MKNQNSLLATFILIASVIQPVFANSAQFEELNIFIEKAKRETGQPSGTALAIIKDGNVIHQGYFGYADIYRKQTVSADTEFYIASTTKPFFALNALLQADRGKFDLQTPMSTMFPEIKFSEFDATAVTLKDLMVHGSGIENNPLGWATAYSGIHDVKSRRELVALSVANKEAGLGSFQYSNIGYNIASVWLEQKLSIAWQDQLQRNVFAPLGMKQTTSYMSRAQQKSWPIALPYSFVNASPNTPLYLKKTDSTMQAAGGIISTVPDLAKFLIAQTSGGRLEGKNVFPERVIAQSQQTQITTDSNYTDFKRSGYAWGWYVGEYKQHTMLHHFGSFAGFHSHMSFIPKQHIALVVLNNEDRLSPRLTALIADYAYGILMNEPRLAKRMDERLAQLVTQAKELQTGMVAQRIKLEQRKWQLSQQLNEYTGTYSHPQLGDMRVSLNDKGKLFIRWGQLEAIAGAFEASETVRVEFSPNSGDTLAFISESNGIAALRFASATFSKMP